MAEEVEAARRREDELLASEQDSGDGKTSTAVAVTKAFGDLPMDEQRRIQDQVWVLLSEGSSDQDICDTVGIPRNTYLAVRKRIFSDGLEWLRTHTAADHFILIWRFYMERIQDLLGIIRFTAAPTGEDGEAKRPTDKYLQARVTAIGKAADLYERAIRLGQDLAVIDKTASVLEIRRVNVGAMTDDELRAEVVRGQKELGTLFNTLKDAGVDFTQAMPDEVIADFEGMAASAG